jgi:hypothetical protein
MVNLRLVGAIAYLLLLMAPATAASRWEYGPQSGYRTFHGPVVIRRMPAQDFDHLDLGIARPTFHSGWGGPYGDGDYPGTVDENMGPPYWAR